MMKWWLYYIEVVAITFILTIMNYYMFKDANFNMSFQVASVVTILTAICDLGEYQGAIR
jgi:hypothetical protein